MQPAETLELMHRARRRYRTIQARVRRILLGLTLLFGGEVGISDEAVEIGFDEQFAELTFRVADDR